MKVHIWSMSKAIHARCLELLNLIAFAEEGTNEYETLKDELQSLPGYPKNMGPDDHTWLDVTSVQH